MKGLKLKEKSAIIKMPLDEWNNYRPQHQGVRFATYGHNKKKDVHGISLYGSSHNPDPREDITMHDINEELARLKIVDERLRTRIFGQTKYNYLQEKPTMLAVSGMANSQGFNGEFDYMNSRMKNKYKKWIPKEEFVRVKKQFKNVQSFGEKKDQLGQKFVLVEFGDITRV
jgi:hypothetical protein